MLLRVDSWSSNRFRHHECSLVVSTGEKEGMMTIQRPESKFNRDGSVRGKFQKRDKLIVELKSEDGELLQVLEIDVPKGRSFRYSNDVD